MVFFLSAFFLLKEYEIMVSQQLLNIIIKAQDQASSTAKKVDDSLKQIGKSSSMLSKIPGFDTMRSKISSVAQTLDGRFGGALTKARNKFSTLKNSVTGVTSTIRGKFGGAVDGIRNKLSGLSKSTSNLQSGFGFLRGAASMAAGMIGYDLVNSLMENTRASLNARSSIQSFGTRLNMSGTEVSNFQADLDKLQSTFKKVDMDVVGQQAMDMAFRLGLPKESLTQLTETSAIFTDAMQRNGRSAEDATLALADAMDGEFRRLKEIGISQEDLMKNGWDGDINNKTGLLNAMNKSLKEQHYDELAKSVDNLDDAWQVLSITMSNLLEGILVPLTPALVGIITGITDAINTIKDAWNGLPDWAQLGIGLGAAALAVGLFAGAVMAAEGGIMALMPGFIAGLYGAASGFLAISIAGAPLWAILAVIVALAVAAYEVGKAFGWWNDVGGMFNAIADGARRLWEAFINHPDVQAAISMISSALSTLWSWITQAGQAILEFFGVATGGDFDIVRALIDGVGNAWNTLKGIIMAVVGVVQAVAGAVSGFWNGSLMPFVDWLNGIFAPVWTFIGDTINAILPLVQGVTSAFTAFQNGQLNLPGLIMTVMTALWNIYLTIFGRIASAVVSWASGIVSNAVSGATRFVQGIIARIMALPGRFLAYLNQTRARIVQQMSVWVSTARTKIAQFVQGIISKITSLPGKVGSLLRSVVSTIKSAIQSWVDAAKEKAQKIVDGVRDALSGTASAVSGALSGVVDAIVKPFRDAYDQAKGLWDKIASLGHASGGESLADIMVGNSVADVDVNTGNSSDSLDVNHNITLDLVNVPAQIDTSTLISMLKDKNVLMALTGNPDCQALDARVKERLNLKQIRARGR